MQKRVMGLVLVLASVASAQNSLSCLQQASNRELVNEISARLGSSNAPVSNTILTTSCTNSYLVLRTFNSDTGSKVEKSFYQGSNCFALKDSLNQVSNVGLSRTIVASICENSYLKSIAISSVGAMTEISSDYVGSNCLQQSIDANKALRP